MQITRIAVPSTALLWLMAATNVAQANQSYYIDQCMSYASGTCGGISTPEETASLQTALAADGWAGSRFTDTAAWPQDLTEQCSATYGTGGLDGSYGDNNGLVVFSGHGNQGYLQFSYPHSATCGFSFDANGRLGSMTGAQATIGMWLACEVHRDLTGFGAQWLRQSLTFLGDIWLGADDAKNVYLSTSQVCLMGVFGACALWAPAKSNAQAWLDVMNAGARHPVAVTMSNYSVDDCWNVHNSAKMRDNVYNYPRGGGPSCGQGQPLYYWCAQWY